MNILITGVCGFVGFSLANKLLKSKKFRIYGIDNLNSYYSKKLKKKRLNILKKYKNFFFYRKDINLFTDILDKYKNVQFNVIYHFAAQAGVRYTIINPNSYLHNNVKAFKNFCKFVKIKKPKKFIFASSSSVYGELKTYPVKENNKLKPKNLYAKTKKFNEAYVKNYFKKTKIKCIGLRLFTVYGEWGRPDMLIFKYIKTNLDKKNFNLTSNGQHFRDFTYINDVLSIVENFLYSKLKKNYDVFNICSNKPIKVLDVIKKINTWNNTFKFKSKSSKILNRIEVTKTHGDNRRVLKLLKKFKYTNFDKALNNTLKWYFDNKINKIT